jgi:Acetoacetate decarboxylase (ADC)
MGVPKRLKEQAGRFALVDDIPFTLPVNSEKTPALMAAFSIDLEKARALMPGNELHPFQFWGRGLLVITVINYKVTDIGKYVEYSIAIACTHGSKPAPRLLPGLFAKTFGTGQFVYDLPVSTEVSVKGGKGIWGMPKHRASLDFIEGKEWITSQYDLNGEFMMKIEVKRPSSIWMPISAGSANYCAFRGMLMKSYIYFKGKAGLHLFKKDSARLHIGNHPKMQALKALNIDPKPVFAAYFPETQGKLDDHFESWFLSYAQPPQQAPEGLESVFNLGRSEDWLPPPTAKESVAS